MDDFPNRLLVEAERQGFLRVAEVWSRELWYESLITLWTQRCTCRGRPAVTVVPGAGGSEYYSLLVVIPPRSWSSHEIFRLRQAAVNAGAFYDMENSRPDLLLSFFIPRVSGNDVAILLSGCSWRLCRLCDY